MKKRILTGLLIIIIVLSTCSCTIGESDYISKIGYYFDTYVSVKLYSSRNETVLTNCLKVCKKYESVFSTTNENSELYQLNKKMAAASEEDIKNPIEISEDLYIVIDKALQYSEMTEGVYDITIRSVTALWDFHGENAALPEQSALLQALKSVDYRNVHVNTDYTIDSAMNIHTKYYISFDKPGIQLELGSIAKGYIADKMKEYLIKLEVTPAVISLGGNVICVGCRDEETDEPFKIGIQTPGKENGDFYELIKGNDNSIVTSGVYERCFTLDGKKYHHILDSETGYPIETDLDSVTIICESSMEADVLSTVCLLEGYENSAKYISAVPNCYAEFVYNDGRIVRTPGFEDYILEE